MKKVLIIGAGISGLSLAYRLQQLSPDVETCILEQADRPGGKAWTLSENGFRVEIGPNGFLDTKPTTVDLARDLNLAERLISASDIAAKNRYLLSDGQLKLLPNSLAAFIKSDLLSWRGKLALLYERFRRRPRSLPRDESIDAFARRRAGDEAADLLADALVTGIFAGDPRSLSLAACFPRLAAFERDHGSVMRGFVHASRQRRIDAAKRGDPAAKPGRMWSFREGMRLLVESLAGSIRGPIHYGVNVRGITTTGDPRKPTWHVDAKSLFAPRKVYAVGSDSWSADALVLTCPAYSQAELLDAIDGPLAKEVADIPYNRVAVVGLAYRSQDVPTSLAGFGFIAPENTARDLLGVQWCSSIFPGRAPDGAVLLRAMCGGWRRPEVVGWDDDRLLAAVRRELRHAQRITAEPVYHKIIRWDRAIPQYHIGHMDRLARIDQAMTRHPGLFLAGNAYRGVALNDCTEQAALLAAQVRQYLG